MKKKKKHMVLRYLIIIILIIIIFIIKIDYSSNYDNNILNILAESEEDKVISIIKKERVLSLDNIDDIGYVSDGIILKNKNKLIKYNYSGKKVWVKKLVLNNCRVYIDKTNIYLYDNKGYIQYLNPKGDIIRELNLNEEIKNLKSDFGELLVYTVDDKRRENFYIINKDGCVYEKNTQFNNKILTYSLSKDKTIYGLGTINFNNLVSSFSTYKKGNKLVYKKDFPGEMILYSKFIDTYRVFIMTDKNIYFLNDFEGNTLWKKQIKNIKDIDFDNDKISIFHGNVIEKLSLKGHVDDKTMVQDYYDRNLFLSDLNIVYGNKKIIVFRQGEKLLDIESDIDIKKVVKGKNKFAVIYKDKVELYYLYE